ncbi:MAG TPA: methyltransferase domain-containing protein [Actinophytocola sp.]|uniref:methyltransferase domain-containing protein n=1 Tax=Actinophytocola sp. TaxID=1872138 RepID=UPI002DBB89F5|nr:methyltransferase domain-containing protein [Actinophytocola sp.]HEU5473422.1 methyltransferase domain-containing protein [Actinophytocola sp.]
MPDVYTTIATAEAAVVGPLVDTLELRAADPRQRQMREEYLSEVAFPAEARVVEIGCGPGPVARSLAVWPGVGEVVGIDPSPVFIEKARELGARLPNLTFMTGDAQALPLPDASVDVAVFHTVLCHVADPALALVEAMRVLRPGGSVAIFDGDYNTVSVATSAADPLQACADAAVGFLVHDRWLPRRLPALLGAAGFHWIRLRGHNYLDAPSASGYLLALIDRGIDALLTGGRVGPGMAEALRAEAKRRSEAGEFFGHIAYVSAIAQRPAQ